MLLLLCYVPVIASAQVAEYPKPIPTDERHLWDDQLNRWWWGQSAHQIRMQVMSEPGWDVSEPEIQSEHNDPDFTMITARQSGPDHIQLFFSLFKGQIYARGFEYPENHPNSQKWDSELIGLSYDPVEKKWFDAYHNTEISRLYYKGRVLYVAKLYSQKDSK